MARGLDRCASLDIYKNTVTVCVRVPDTSGDRIQHVRSFATTTAELLMLRDCLEAHRVSHVAMGEHRGLLAIGVRRPGGGAHLYPGQRHPGRPVRMHWLYFDERAPEWLDEAGFTYGSTLGYNETVGFRAGTMQAFKPLTAGRLLESPLTIMDTASFYASHLNLTLKAAKQKVWRLLDAAERYRGALTINWYDRGLAPERLWGKFYVEIVDELRRRGAWFPTVTQAASRFSQRRSAKCDSIRWDGASIRIRASARGSEGALDACLVSRK